MVAYIDVKVRTDATDVRKDLDRAAGATSTAGGRIKSALAGIGGAMAAAFAADKIKDFVMESITAASDLNETLSKTNQIFGDSAGAIEQWSKDSSNAVGMSQTAALDAADTFAIFGKSAGLTGDDLVGFSTKLVGTAADFASFANTTPDEAIQAIGAALRGETEPIRKYGLMINDATIKQQAMKMGLIKTTTQAINPAKKALAVNGLIQAFSKSQKIAGDFQRTSGGLANQQRILAAKVQNAKAAIGQALLPVMLAGVQVAMRMGKVFQSLAGWVGDNIDAIVLLGTVMGVAYVAINATALATKAYGIYTKAVTAITKGWAAAQAALNAVMAANPIALVIIAIVALVAAFIYAYKHFDWFRAGVQKTMRAVVKAFQWIWTALKGVWDKVYPLLKKWGPLALAVLAPFIGIPLILAKNWRKITGWLRGVWDGIKNIFNAGWTWIKNRIITPMSNMFNNALRWVTRGLSGVKNAITKPFSEAWSWIGSHVLTPMSKMFTNAVHWVTNGLSGVKDAITKPFSDAWSWIQKNVFGPVKTVWNGLANAINSVHISLKVPSFVPGIGGKGWEWRPPHVPLLAKGGYVTQPTLAIIGESGPEYVVPANQMGGYTINVYGALDPDNVARQIDRILRGRAQRVGGVRQS